MQSADYQIRNIRPEDNVTVCEVIRTVMPEFGACGPGYAINDAEVEAMHEAYSKPRCRYYVVEREGRVLGGAGIAPLQGGDEDICELKKMYLLDELRGKGIGSRLLERLLIDAAAFGYRRCYLETLDGMDAANALYRKFDFQPLNAPMGDTGHFSCNTWYLKTL